MGRRLPACRIPGRTWGLAIGLTLAACAAPRRDWQRGEWVVVTDLVQPGLRADSTGTVLGEQADLLRAVAEETDRVLVWSRVDPERALELLESGRADVAVYPARVTEEWGDRVDPVPAPHDDLGWRLTPARSGVAEALLAALERVRRPRD